MLCEVSAAIEFLTEEVQLAQAGVDGEALIRRQFLVGQPSVAPLAEEIAHRRSPLEVALQYHVDLVLDLPCGA